MKRLFDFYDCLKNNQCRLAKDDDKIIAYVFIRFSEIEDFIKNTKLDFSDGSIECHLCECTLCVEINSILEDFNIDITDIKNCFSETEWNCYFDKNNKRRD